MNTIPVDFGNANVVHTHVLDRDTIEKTFTQFIVLGLGYWGKGKTLKEAKRNCMGQGAKAKDKMVAFWGTEDITVTTAGYVTANNMVSLGEV